MKQHEIFDKAFDKWGWDKQMVVLMEECAELIKESSKCIRTDSIGEDFYNELADVEIMLGQFKRYILCEGDNQAYKLCYELKLKKLENYLNEK